MTITYKLEPNDLRAFLRYGQKHLPNARRARYIVNVGMIAVCLLLTFSSNDHRISFRIVYFCLWLLIFWTFMRIWLFITLRLVQWRSFTADKQRSVLCEHTMTLADDALVEVTPFNESRSLWNGVYRVVDAADYIYIFLSLHSAHIIPKRAFPDADSARKFYDRAVSLQSAAQKVAS